MILEVLSEVLLEVLVVLVVHVRHKTGHCASTDAMTTRSTAVAAWHCDSGIPVQKGGSVALSQYALLDVELVVAVDAVVAVVSDTVVYVELDVLVEVHASHNNGHLARIAAVMSPYSYMVHLGRRVSVHEVWSSCPWHVLAVDVGVLVLDDVVLAVVPVEAVCVVVDVCVVDVCVVAVIVVAVVTVVAVVVSAVVAVVVAHFSTAAYSSQRGSFTLPAALQFLINNLQAFVDIFRAKATQSGLLPHAAAHVAALPRVDPATCVLANEAGRTLRVSS